MRRRAEPTLCPTGLPLRSSSRRKAFVVSESRYASAALVTVLIALGVFFAGGVSVARKAVEAFSDRVTVFLYLSIPLGLMSPPVILGRLIF